MQLNLVIWTYLNNRLSGKALTDAWNEVATSPEMARWVVANSTDSYKSDELIKIHTAENEVLTVAARVCSVTSRAQPSASKGAMTCDHCSTTWWAAVEGDLCPMCDRSMRRV